MARLPHVDVVLVGFGLVNSVIANELGKHTNLNIVALERGPYRETVPDFLQDHFDEWRYAVQGELFQDLSRNTVTFRNDRRQTALPMRQWGAFLVGSGVGGSMVHWNGHSYRFLPHVFEYRSRLEDRYGPDFLPEDCTIQDWGIAYEELEPFYTRYEKTFGVAGKAGNIKGDIQPGGNPLEGPRSEEYPQPPLKQAYGPTFFRDACATRRLGLPGPKPHQPRLLHQPGWDDPRLVQLLRLLRALWLPRRRQGQPDNDGHPERAQERPSRDSAVLERLPDQSHWRPGDLRLLLRRIGTGAGAAGRPDRRRGLDAGERSAPPPVGDWAAVRSGSE